MDGPISQRRKWSNSASIALNAGQLYNLQLDYFQNTGNAVAQLLWSSPSTPQAVIPQTQLYSHTNPPPAVVISAPANGATFTAPASVSFIAEADALYNSLGYVSFYTNGVFLAAVSNAPYSFTATGLTAGDYMLTATAIDDAGVSGTSAPVSFTVAAGSGLPYGLATNGVLAPFLNLNLPGAYTGPIPLLLSGTGAYADTPNRVPTPGLIPYLPNTPLWSDSAVKSRYLGVPNNAGTAGPGRQIGFGATGQWTFPEGTVFVKNFDLIVDQATNPSNTLCADSRPGCWCATPTAQFRCTYKWRPDNSDADLLTDSLEAALVTNNATGVVTQKLGTTPVRRIV